MTNLVPSAVLEGVAELIEQNGQDPVELFRRVGIPEAALLISFIGNKGAIRKFGQLIFTRLTY